MRKNLSGLFKAEARAARTRQRSVTVATVEQPTRKRRSRDRLFLFVYELFTSQKDPLSTYSPTEKGVPKIARRFSALLPMVLSGASGATSPAP